MTSIAFIGLGNMGGPMAANLAAAGHDVRVFDLSAAAVARAAEAGCVALESASQAADGVDAVVTMLPNGSLVSDVFQGHDAASGLFTELSPGTLVVDCSTIDVPTSRILNTAARRRELEMVDAPVSGGVAAAQAGSLTFMVGGTPDGFNRAKPILEVMGKAVIHAGEAGAGQAAKICNNMLLAISMIGTCEAFALADRLGLDRQRFFDIASQASGQSWSMTSYCPVPGPVPAAPSNRDYAPGFATAMMLKDLKLAQAAAAGAGATTPLGAQAEALYAMFDRLGGGQTDFSGIFTMISGDLTAPRKGLD